MASNMKRSYWDSKPYWCQPFSIIAFGIFLIIIIWTLFKSFLLTIILGFIVTVWWILFLILAPKAYESIHEEK